ncbi:MAG: diphosphate--fructose-6-phosphate 1-phosphotransferase [Candidatus Cloacimonadota bacterium]|nr:MAG: diphosphate--fructose-6-phosphate 1-phosphotransferase [Candidatus Cloacimonadota bacterium]
MNSDELVVKQVKLDEALDFNINSLGKCKVISPLNQDGKRFVSDKTLLNYFHFNEQFDSFQKTFNQTAPRFEVAGPRKNIYFEPNDVNAAIVTCGGLCPGINNVIRAITFTLNLYGVKRIIGIPYGYEGLIKGYGHNVKILNAYAVSNIHTNGGTILGTSRGPQEPVEMVDFLVENKINMLFTIGGDGTQKGALAISEEIKKRGLKISIVGIPKTIDNDLGFVEKTFGFETAVEFANKSVQGAHNEAVACQNGIAILKLMGRDSGYIAAQTALASMNVNICLVPENDFDLNGPNGLLATITKRLNFKRHCVIAVAEGAGQKFFSANNLTDKSGNPKLGDIGLFLKEKINENFQNHPLRPTLKYIDPSYLIRSQAASANDSVFCLRLGQGAVHAAMAGKTAMIAGYWNRIFTHVPMQLATKSRKKIRLDSAFWQSVLEVTRQPRDMTLQTHLI